MAEPLGILLLSGEYDRAHYALMLAAAAAAIGRPVILFATNAGCRALTHDWTRLDGAAEDTQVIARGVAGFAELRDAARDLAVRFIACDSGLRIAAIDPASLLPEVEISGIPAFLSALGAGQVITL